MFFEKLKKKMCSAEMPHPPRQCACYRVGPPEGSSTDSTWALRLGQGSTPKLCWCSAAPTISTIRAALVNPLLNTGL